MTALMASGMLALTVPAHAANNLDCMDSGYTPEQQAVADAFVAGVNPDNVRAGPPADLQALVNTRSEVCGAQHGWTEGARDMAPQLPGLRRRAGADGCGN
jgi:hypothetical protein